MMPAWRMPPPKSLRFRRTSWITSASPATAEPTGAPRPFEKHTETVSTSATSAAGGTPSATAAFQRRAPSMCMSHPVPPREGRDVADPLGREDEPARLADGVLDADQALAGVVRGRSRRATRPRASRRRACRDRRRATAGWTPERAETPPCSWTTTWAMRWTRISSPRRVCARTAAWFPIVPEGTYTAASFPSMRAVSASSAMTVGSSPQTSSPTSASAIARRISGVGRVTVSERRSTGRIARTVS